MSRATITPTSDKAVRHVRSPSRTERHNHVAHGCVLVRRPMSIQFFFKKKESVTVKQKIMTGNLRNRGQNVKPHNPGGSLT